MDVNKEAGHSMSFRIQRTMGQSGTPSYLRQNRIASYTAMFGSSPVGKRHQADLCNEHASVRILGLSGAQFRGICFDQYSCLSNAFTELARESRLIKHDFLVKPHRLGEFACSPALTLHLVAFGLMRRDVVEQQWNAKPGQQYAERDDVNTRYSRCGYSQMEARTCSLCNFVNA